MQRGRLGGIPLPRTIPIRDGGIGSGDGRPQASYSREGAGTVWRCSMLLLRGGAPHTPQPPQGPPPQSLKIKKR